MSTLSALSSPLLRRTWICRACIRSQRQTIPQPYGLWQQRSTSAGHNAFASRIGSSRTFASQANEAANATPKAAGRSSKSSKRRTRLLIAGGGIAIGAAVVTVNCNAGAQHQRVCACVHSPAQPNNPWLIYTFVQLPRRTQARRRTRLQRATQSLPPAMRQAYPTHTREERLHLHQAGTTSEQHELPAAERMVRYLHTTARQMSRILLRIHTRHVPTRHGP